MSAVMASELTKDQVCGIGLSATTLEEIAQARQVLRAWQAAHPEEMPMYDVFEQLANMEDAQHAIAAESDKEAA